MAAEEEGKGAVSETEESFLEFLYGLADPIFAHRVTLMLLCQCILFGEISLSLLCLVMLRLLVRINS